MAKADPGVSPFRLMLMSDTHLGLDLPFRPRIQRRRRGLEFFNNFHRVLDDAVAMGVDGIIHGGDLFYRSRIPKMLVEMVFEPLKRVADSGIPIFIVPGNHERSKIPHSELSLHPNIFVFTRPRTFRIAIRGQILAVSGFPFLRGNIRDHFTQIVERTQWRHLDADHRLLCMHQTVQGASVGPVNYVFRGGPDVIRARDIPPEFSAVLSGHIHRFQVLKTTPWGKPLEAPVFYPGAIDRVSFAERNETKGYLSLNIGRQDQNGRPGLEWRFNPLPSRPMWILNFRPGYMGRSAFISLLQQRLDNFPADSIVKLIIRGKITKAQSGVLKSAFLRSLAKPTMNISATLADLNVKM